MPPPRPNAARTRERRQLRQVIKSLRRRPASSGSSSQSAEHALHSDAAARTTLLDALGDIELFPTLLQSQGTAGALAQLLKLSLVSRAALQCVRNACTWLCDAENEDRLNELLSPATHVSMRTSREDCEVKNILWHETNQSGGKGGNKLLPEAHTAGTRGGPRGDQWKLDARMRIAHALWVASGLLPLGPVLPFSGKHAQQFYEELFAEDGLAARTYDNRHGYAQINLFLSVLSRALPTDGINKPHLRFVLDSIRLLEGLTVPGTDIPAVRMSSGYGWVRLLARDGRRVESTGGAKDGGQHLDAAPSEKRKQLAAAHARRLEQIPGVDAADVRLFVRVAGSVGAYNKSEWISPSNHGEYLIEQSVPSGYANGYAGFTRQTNPAAPNRNSHGGAASAELRVQSCFDTDAMHVPTVRGHFLRRAVDWTLRDVPRSLLCPADGEEVGADAARLNACMAYPDLGATEQAQCRGWLLALSSDDGGVHRSAELAALATIAESAQASP